MRKLIICVILCFAQNMYAQSIVRVEYYIDTDPGFGSGTPVSITPGANLDLNFDVNLSSVSVGMHTLFLRAKDENGHWSLVFEKPFLKEAVGSKDATPNMSEMEYFIDMDPGLGNGTSVSITPAVNVDKNFVAALIGVNSGIHTIFVRSKDENSQWSLVFERPFLKEAVGSQETLPDITSIRYYHVQNGVISDTTVHTDFTASSNVDDNLTVDLSGLDVGSFYLHMFGVDANKMKSLEYIHEATVVQEYTDTEPASLEATISFNENSGGDTGDGHTVEMQFTSLQGSGNITVLQTNQSPSDPPTSNYLDYTWDLTKDAGITAFNAELTFHYLDSDVSGLDESELKVYRWDGSSWQYLGGTVNEGENKITVEADQFSDYAIFEMSDVLVKVKAWLEGAYQAGGSMTTDLNTGGHITTQSPHSDSRTVGSVPSGVTDWIQVELRSSPSGSAVSQRSFFARNDGSVVDRDGTTVELSMPGVEDGDYYIVIRHRNHLAIMSASAVTLNGSSVSLYDFTTGSGQFYGTGGTKELESGVWGMWSGDINQDGEVTTEDYTTWYNSARAGDSGYQTTDINLDGEVTTSDYTIWYNNARAGASSGLP